LGPDLKFLPALRASTTNFMPACARSPFMENSRQTEAAAKAAATTT
jgi:hypothetical protein